MRRPIFALSLAILLTPAGVWAQAMTEAAAAAAGSTAGGVAGKKVSEGISTIFGKVDQQTKKAAAPEATKQAKAAGKPAVATTSNALQVGPGVPRGESVPPPPPIKRVAKKQPAPAAVEPTPEPAEIAAAPAPVPVEPPAPKPPAPKVTVDDLNSLAKGTSRDDLLKLGQFASRIMMFEDGHLVELYRYMSGDTTLGSVRVSDGAVANVTVRR